MVDWRIVLISQVIVFEGLVIFFIRFMGFRSLVVGDIMVRLVFGGVVFMVKGDFFGSFMFLIILSVSLIIYFIRFFVKSYFGNSLLAHLLLLCFAEVETVFVEDMVES
jgi:hypothetical protein